MDTKTQIVESYFPDIDDLDVKELQAQRAHLEAFLRQYYPDLDMRPNTPFGDLFLSPATTLKVAMEAALVGILKDMDLTNLEAGIVGNCDFAEMFLANFGDFERKSVGSYGFVRLVFSENTYISIPGHTRFKFGTNESDNEFTAVRPYQGELRFYPAGQELPAGTNSWHLVQEGTDRYAVLIPVIGLTSEDIPENVAAFTTPAIPTTRAMNAACDIPSAIVPTSIPDMARLARNTVFDASFSSKRSAESFAWSKIPELLAVSSAKTGDYSMRRATTNPMGLTTPCLDLFVRSGRYAQRSVLLYARYDPAADLFYAKLPFSGPLDRMISVTYPEDDTVTLSVFELMSSPTRDNVALAENGVQGREVLFVSAAMPRDNEGAALIPLDVNANGDGYATLEFVFEYDPAVAVMQGLGYGDDDAPAGVRLDIRPFVSVVVDRMEISYQRPSTTSMSLEDAEVELTKTMHQFSHRRPFSPATIDAIVLAAGATVVHGTAFDTHLEFSAAHSYLPSGVAALPDTYAELVAARKYPAAVTRNNLETPKPPVTAIGPAGELLGERNYCYAVRPGSIVFTEVV